MADKGENLPKLTEYALNISELQISAFTWGITKTNRSAGLIVFSGEYKAGSAGRKDAMYISHMMNLFIRSSHIKGLIIDFRKMSYVGGDNLSVTPPPDWVYEKKPVKVVIPSEADNLKVNQAYRGILGDTHTTTDYLQAFIDVRDIIRNS